MAARTRPITLLIAALGGEGGGVLSGWVRAVAEVEGYLVQSTSVPGVAQRTGATTYYIEMFPEAEIADYPPVMALLPAPGDLDIMLASELLEAARGIERGFVTPGRTTLIASTHRVYSISEKTAMADGRWDGAPALAAAKEMSARFIHADMSRLAHQSGSIINAVLLGALAGSGRLPFARGGFENVIRLSGIAVEANLRGFAAGWNLAAGGTVAEKPGEVPSPTPDGTPGDFPPGIPLEIQVIAGAGLARLKDYQDKAYAKLYLDRLEPIVVLDRRHGGPGHDFELSNEVARYLALRMSFEDVLRIADLKTRKQRRARIAAELGLKPDQIMHVSEFLRPGVDEMCSVMPPWLARMVLASRLLSGLLAKFTKGRQVSTTSITGFFMLWLMARLVRWRRGTFRFQQEQVMIEDWLAAVREALAHDYGLGVEMARAANLIKGYGDTYKRGAVNFAAIRAALPGLVQSGDGAGKLRRLREAALADEDGEAFDAALAEVA